MYISIGTDLHSAPPRRYLKVDQGAIADSFVAVLLCKI